MSLLANGGGEELFCWKTRMVFMMLMISKIKIVFLTFKKAFADIY